jgi:hypothetical protein
LIQNSVVLHLSRTQGEWFLERDTPSIWRERRSLNARVSPVGIFQSFIREMYSWGLAVNTSNGMVV